MGLLSLLAIFFLMLFTVGIWLMIRKRYKLLFLGIILPSILCIGCLVGFLFFMSYQPKPNDLDISITKQGNHYIAKGEWKKPLDYYRFPTDYIVFTLPKGSKVKEMERPRYEHIGELDSDYLKRQVLSSLGTLLSKSKTYQVEDIEASKHVSFSFKLPKDVSLEDVSISYVHVHSEPMDENVYWVKRIE